jgi:hypothetical protein
MNQPPILRVAPPTSQTSNRADKHTLAQTTETTLAVTTLLRFARLAHKKTCYLILCVLLAGSLSLHAQQSGVFEALYIYKFAIYLRFPTSSDTFVIGIVGNSDIGVQLEKNVHGKKVGAAVVVVKKYANPSDIEDCAIVFVPESQKSKLPQVVSRFKNKSTVIVTQGAGACVQGNIISLTPDQAKKFEINRTAIEMTGVKVAAEIMQVAALCPSLNP